MAFNLAGTTITAAQVAQWQRLGLTDDQIQDSIEYNRKYTQDQAFQQAEKDRLAAAKAVKTAADAEIRGVAAEVKRIVAEGTAAAAGKTIPGTTVQEVIDNFPIDYAAAAEAVRRLAPSLTKEQAESNVKAVVWGQPVTITESTKQAAAVQTAPAAKAVVDLAPAPAPLSVQPAGPAVGFGAPDYSDPTQAAAAAANDARLQSDPAFVEAEIERTLQVLMQREAAGLDCTAQNAYLDRLEAAQRGTPWLVTGPGEQGAPAGPKQAGAVAGLPPWMVYAGVGISLLLMLVKGR